MIHAWTESAEQAALHLGFKDRQSSPLELCWLPSLLDPSRKTDSYRFLRVPDDKSTRVYHIIPETLVMPTEVKSPHVYQSIKLP